MSQGNLQKKTLKNFFINLQKKVFPTKYNRYISQQTRAKLTLFRGIESIGKEKKKRFFLEMLRFEILLAQARDIEKNQAIPVMMIFSLPTLIVFFLSPFWVSSFFNFSFEQDTGSLVKAGYYFLYVISLYLIFLLFVASLNIKFIRINLVYVFYGTVSLLIIAYLYLTQESRQMDVLSIGIISIFSVLLFFNLYTFIILIPLEILIRWIAGYKLRSHPQAAIAGKLLKVLARIEFFPDLWSKIKFKQEICQELEIIAGELQKYASRIRTRDVETDLWFKEHFAEIAQSFRTKKRLVLNPLVQSRQELITFIARSLIIVLEGNWANLKTEKLPTLKEGSKLWLKKSLEVLRSIVVSALPLALLYLLQLTTLRFEEPYFSYAKIGGIGWFVISFIIMIDPLYNSKLSALKEIKGIFPFSKKD